MGVFLDCRELVLPRRQNHRSFRARLRPHRAHRTCAPAYAQRSHALLGVLH